MENMLRGLYAVYDTVEPDFARIPKLGKNLALELRVLARAAFSSIQ